MQRPLLSDGKCPGNLVPCNEGTTVENTICYDPEEKDENCPIIDVSFLEVPGVKLRTVLAVRFFDDEKDQLPIGATRVETKPCMNPNETSGASLTSNSVYLPIENDRNNECSADLISDETFDYRYYPVGEQKGDW